ncbi:MAG: hypothetical protein ABR915_21830 [Thermoguttaceae bacterium]|jgi:hypothetical protein
MKAALLSLQVAAVVLVALPASAATPVAELAPAPQVWLVNTRSVPSSGDLDSRWGHLSFWQMDPCDGCRWLPADAEAFRRSVDTLMPTAIFVAGYGTGVETTIEEATRIYCDMQRAACGRPFRLVIWSWPSDRNRRVRLARDLRAKAFSCDAEALYLARTLPELPPATPIGLIGYSYGARIVGGAVELLTGGEVAGQRLPAEVCAGWAAAPRPVRVMFIAAAMDADWLAGGHRCGEVLALVEGVAVTLDDRDRVLRRYTRLPGRGGPQALGRIGPVGCQGAKLELLDVTCAVGKKHDWKRYEPAVSDRVAWYTFLAE